MALADEVIEAIREGVPAYRRPLRGRFGAGIRIGAEEVLGQFADLISDPDLDRSGGERVYRGLGGGEYRERRSLDALLAAYRLGARVSWRRVAEIAIDAGVDRRTLALLAEAVFAYIDELTALSGRGLRGGEQSVAAGETCSGAVGGWPSSCSSPIPTRTRPRDAAADAGWTPPTEVIAALVWADGGRRVRRDRRRRRSYRRRGHGRRGRRSSPIPTRRRSALASSARRLGPCDARPHGAPARGGDQRRPRRAC